MDIESLNAKLSYDPDTGRIAWRHAIANCDPSKQAGYFCHRKGYRIILFEGDKCIATSLIWWIHYGEAPKARIIHLNGDRDDFRICNLAEFKRNDAKVTDDQIRGAFIYSPSTGHLYSLVCLKQIRRERIVRQGRSEYWRVDFRGKNFLSHRIAWFLYYGEWPKGKIDHINHDSTDNRIQNLRDVSQSENLRNSKKSIKNTSGVTGVSKSSTPGKWCAWIGDKSKRISLGTFKTFEEAVAARKQAEIDLGYHYNHGK